MGLLDAFRSCLDSLRPGRTADSTGEDNNAEDGLDSFELFFSLNTLQIATNFFSELNKLGHGGFGPVFKVRICKFPLRLVLISETIIYIILNLCVCSSEFVYNKMGDTPEVTKLPS